MLSLILSLLSQNPMIRTFGGFGVDEGWSILPLSNGNLVIVGSTTCFVQERKDALIIEIDSVGNVIWSLATGSMNLDIAYGVTQVKDGGFLVVGTSSSYSDGLMIKTDAFGNILWEKKFGNPSVSVDEFTAVIPVSGDSFVLIGATSYGFGDRDFLFVRMDTTGSSGYSHHYGGNNLDRAWCIVQSPGSGYLLVGETETYGMGGYDCLIIKIQSEGWGIWAKTIGGAEDDKAYSVVVTPDGGYLIAGYTESYGSGEKDILLVKMQDSGDIAWIKAIGGPADDVAYSLAQIDDTSYLLTGYTCNYGSGDKDLFLVKIDSCGSLLWARVLENPGEETLRRVCLTPDGWIAAVGVSSSLSGDSEVLFLKVDKNGLYPGCLKSCWPTIITISPYVLAQPHVGPYYFGPNGLIDLPDSVLNLQKSDLCPPTVEESPNVDSRPLIICSNVPGGVLFISGQASPVTMYSPDGRIAFLGQLQKGKTRIPIGQGVYLWRAGPCKGKVVVR